MKVFLPASLWSFLLKGTPILSAKGSLTHERPLTGKPFVILFFLMKKTKFELQMSFAFENSPRETTSVNEQYPLLSGLPIYMEMKMEDGDLDHPFLISSMEDEGLWRLGILFIHSAGEQKVSPSRGLPVRWSVRGGSRWLYPEPIPRDPLCCSGVVLKPVLMGKCQRGQSRAVQKIVIF